MKEQEKQAAKAAKLAEKRIALESSWLAREQAIQKDQAAKEAKREKKRIAEEPARIAREQARRKTALARERAVAEDQEARRRKMKNQPPE
jgi:hypothetical protein